MSSHRTSRGWRSKAVIIPLAISVAAATAAGLWFFLDDHDHHHHHHSHEHLSDTECESDAGGQGAPGPSYSNSQRRRTNIPLKSSIGPSSKTTGAPGGDLSRVDEESERESYRASIPPTVLSPTSPTGGSRTYIHPIKTRTVALVVSAGSVNSSLLSFLPRPLIIPPNTTLHILIYTPSLTQHNPAGTPLAMQTQPLPPSSIHDLAYGILPVSYPKEFILPYTTHPTGTSSLLRHLSPEIVYMEETLAGPDGSVIRDLISKGWVREGVVVLGTGPGAIGGLLDKESEDEEGLEKIGYGEAGVKGKEKASKVENVAKGKRWWEEPGWDGGRGGGSVLEREYLGEDWGRRVVDRK